MKTLALLFSIILSWAVLANTATDSRQAPRKKLDRKKMMERWYNRTGGKIEQPNAKQGKIVFVNSQDKADICWIQEVATKFSTAHNIDISIQQGQFTFPNPKINGNATLYIVNDSSMPTLLHAPENRWTLVNISRLQEGNGAKPQFFAARFKKELTRAFCLLAGSQSSNYPGSLLTNITNPSQLDKFPDCELPVDIPERFVPYLEGFGIKPAIFTTYKKACEEGWAPTPTNDVQKAIWDKVHSAPKTPMRIQFDPKKGR